LKIYRELGNSRDIEIGKLSKIFPRSALGSQKPPEISGFFKSAKVYQGGGEWSEKEISIRSRPRFWRYARRR